MEEVRKQRIHKFRNMDNYCMGIEIKIMITLGLLTGTTCKGVPPE